MDKERNKPVLWRIWIILLSVSYLLFSYYYFEGWWNSSVGTILIILFSYKIWRKDFLIYTGLKLNLKIIAKSLILAGLITICSLMIMKYLADRQNIKIQYTSWRNYYHDIYYILNEEIVIGALILFTLVYSRKVQPLIASAGLAIAFSLIHYIFYRWIFEDRGIIQASTLLTLLFIGIVRNNLIIVMGHIGYSWALHFGWMVIMFGCLHSYADTGGRMTEIDRFNTYLGSVEMLIISFILAALSLIHLIIRKSHAGLIKPYISYF